MLPVTVALKACVVPVVSCTGAGVIWTATGWTGTETVMVACADAVVSATAIAFTWYVPATMGAV